MRNNSKAAALHLIPYYLSQNKHSNRTSGNRDSDDIYDMAVGREKVSSSGTKKGIEKSGFHLR